MPELTTLEELAGETLGQLHGNGEWPIETCFVAAYGHDGTSLASISTGADPWTAPSELTIPAEAAYLVLFAKDSDRFNTVLGVAADGERIMWVDPPETVGEIKVIDPAKLNEYDSATALFSNLSERLNRARHG